MAFYIEPVYEKWFVRFLVTASNYFSCADNALLDYAANKHFGIMVTFRTTQADAIRTICEKIGAGASVAAGIGWTLDMSTAGKLKITLNHDDGAAGTHTDTFETTTGSLNDGKVRTAVFWLDRTSDAADKGKWYLGEPGEVTAMALDSSHAAAHTAMSLANDGVFTISDATEANRWGGDIFILRIFNNLVLTSAMATALNGDLSSRIDSHAITTLVYTTDPATTGGCVAEYVKTKPSVYSEWDTLEDTSGNALHAIIKTEDCYYYWDTFLLPKSSYTLGGVYIPQDEGMKRDTNVIPYLSADGGVDIGFGKFGARNINYAGKYKAADAATLDAYVLAMVQALAVNDGRVRDSNRNSAKGFLRYSTMNGFRSKYINYQRVMVEISFGLTCPDPAWHNTFTQSGEKTVSGGSSPYTYKFSITNNGNIDCPVVWSFTSAANDNGWIKVENYNEQINGSPINFTLNESGANYFWRRPDTGGDDHGKTIVVDGVNGRVKFLGLWYANDNSGYCDRMKYFNGHFFMLKPGENRICVTLTSVGGNIGTMYLTADFWEKHVN